MSIVVINVLTVPEGRGDTLEARFAGRAGQVDRAEGFEGFQLLRPVAGTDRYLVWTRWRSRADFDSWQQSQAFGAGHGAPREGGPAATGSEIWTFDVALESGPAT